jgi:hypothetical protein
MRRCGVGGTGSNRCLPATFAASGSVGCEGFGSGLAPRRDVSSPKDGAGNLNGEKQEIGRWANNQGENSHLSFRRQERARLRFGRMKSLQKFTWVHPNVH